MSLAKRYYNSGNNATPSEITCANYTPLENSRRCKYYGTNGACSIPENFMCTEWLKLNSNTQGDKQVDRNKANGSKVATSKQTNGFTLTNPKPELRPIKEKVEDKRTFKRRGNADLLDAADQRPLDAWSLKPADIESFKALGVEVCFEYGAEKIWLVSVYSERDRNEITPDHLATLCQLLQAFPGAHITSFKKANFKKGGL